MVDQNTNRDDAEHERLLAIYRGWKTAQDRTILSKKFLIKDFGMSAWISAALSAPCIFLDGSLLSWEPFREISLSMAPNSFLFVVSSFILIAAINSILFHRASLRQISKSSRWWMIIAHTVTIALPVIGHTGKALWAGLQRQESSSPPQQEAFSMQGRSGQKFFPHYMREISLSHELPNGGFAWLFASGYSWLLLGVFWLTRWAASSNNGHLAAVITSALLHLLMCAMVFLAALNRTLFYKFSSAKRFTLLALSLIFFLVPAPPATLLGIVTILALEPMTARSHTLPWAVKPQRKSHQAPLWRELQDSLHHTWKDFHWLRRLWSPPSPVRNQLMMGTAEGQTLKLFDFLTFTLALDATCLGLVLSRAAGDLSSWTSTVTTVYSSLVLAPLLLSLAALAAAAIPVSLILFRLNERPRWHTRQPYAIYFSRAQFALSVGLFLGIKLPDDPGEVGMLIVTVCGFLASFKCLLAMLTTLMPKTRWHRPLAGYDLYILALVSG